VPAARIIAIALNTYREAVRARVLIGVFAAALAAAAYSLVVATLSLHNEPRVVADLGAASVSLFSVLVAIVMGSTSLHRELEHKTVFPILSRPIRRWEYLVGKYVGTLVTVAVFVALDAAIVLAMLALETGQPAWKVGAVAALLLAILGVTLVRAKYTRVFVVIPWSAAAVLAAWLLASTAGADRQLVVASAALTLSEIAVVAAVATLFASFSSPFLTAMFTVMVFVIGRSADTLAHMPKRIFGAPVATFCKGLARVVPNLHVYVPARTLLLGEVPSQPVWSYVGLAALHAALYATVLLVVSAIVFRKRDFA
jgi:Cu-processing system permease protein